MKKAGILLLALLCGAAAQALVAPRALEARRCWPPDSSQNIGWKHAAPIVGRELTADILWAKTLVYYGDARFRQSDSIARELPLLCGPRPGRLEAAIARGLELPAPAAQPGARSTDPRCMPCGPDWNRPDFRYLEPMLDALIEVDPAFKRVYRWAAFAVTYKESRPTQEEFLVSLKYLHKAMERFPDDPEYPWLAGTRYFMDLQSDDPVQQRAWREQGVELIETAMRKPNAPRSYAELAAAFNTKLGRQQRAIADLQEVILTVDNAEARARLLDKLRQYQADDLADELEQVTRDLETRWRATLPFAPPTFYLILGDRPSPVIDFDKLATERDLFGADEP